MLCIINAVFGLYTWMGMCVFNTTYSLGIHRSNIFLRKEFEVKITSLWVNIMKS